MFFEKLTTMQQVQRNLEGWPGCMDLMYEVKCACVQLHFAGQEDYDDSLHQLSYHNTDVVLMCFSIDNPGTFKTYICLKCSIFVQQVLATISQLFYM